MSVARGFRISDHVATPFGNGVVKGRRPDANDLIVGLDSGVGTCYVQGGDVSCILEAGDFVSTPYGDARILNLRESQVEVEFAGIEAKGYLQKSQVTIRRNLWPQEKITKAVECRLLGNKVFKAGEYSAAILLYQQALKLLEMGAPVAGVPEATNIQKQDMCQNVVLCLINLAQANLCLNNFKEAELHCSQALRIDPHCAKAYFRRARVRQERGNFGEAIADFQQALHCLPKSKDKQKVRDEISRGMERCKIAMKEYKTKTSKIARNMFSAEDATEKDRKKRVADQYPESAPLLKHMRLSLPSPPATWPKWALTAAATAAVVLVTGVWFFKRK